MAKTQVKPQMHMDEKVVEDAELEKMLENRQEQKYAVANYRQVDKEVKEKLRSLETPTPYRIGRFRINKTMTPARSVSFEANESVRFSIKLAGEEE